MFSQQQGKLVPCFANPLSAATMATADKISSLRRRRGHYLRQFTLISKRLDEYKQSGRQEECDLLFLQKHLDKYGTEFYAIQLELEELTEEENARGTEMSDQYLNIGLRINHLLKSTRLTSLSMPTNGESDTGFEPISIKLPEIHLPTFDGTIENSHSFYDSFSFTIDRSERLTPVQKSHYLRSSLTGRAARSIQSLDITEINYSSAIDFLKEKFDCQRQVCMRHWDLIFEYPKITKETPEAVDDFLETVKVNLHALEKLSEPVTSNVVLIKLFTSKLLSVTIRKWQRTLRTC